MSLNSAAMLRAVPGYDLLARTAQSSSDRDEGGGGWGLLDQGGSCDVQKTSVICLSVYASSIKWLPIV